MKHSVNQSQTWFKILSLEGVSIDQEQTEWKLPQREKKGDWIESTSPIGTMLVSNPKDFILGAHTGLL